LKTAIGATRRIILCAIREAAPAGREGRPVACRATSRNQCSFASKRLRKRVLHHCTHLGTKTCGRIQLDRCCLVIRLHKVKEFAPASMFTLSVWTGPLPLRILTVAGIVGGAPGSPKLSYASERTTVLNLTAPESSGGGRGTTRRRDPGGPPPGVSWSMKTE